MAKPNKNPLAIAARKLRTAADLPFGVIVLAALAWLLLWPARLAVLTIPLRRMVKVFGADHGVNPAIPIISEPQVERARTVKRAIALAAKYSPKSANCYPQALVGRLFLKLRRIPHGLFFGLRRREGTTEMEAHAWVMAGPLPVTGGHSFGRFTVVRSFLSEPGA